MLAGLLQTDFGQSDYWANNFNDMPSAMVCPVFLHSVGTL